MDTRGEQPGLRMRVEREARRISSQHRQLDVFYGMVNTAIDEGNASRARSEFLRLRDALDAHFTIEEQVHFPAVHGLWPDLDQTLADLVAEHRTFREDLDSMSEQLRLGQLEACGAALDRFVLALAGHEGREERMSEDIQRQRDRARNG